MYIYIEREKYYTKPTDIRQNQHLFDTNLNK